MKPDPFEERLTAAVKHHRAQRLNEAEELYRQILYYRPKHADALFLLGSLMRQKRDLIQALELIRRAIEVDPTVADYYNNLATTLLDLGRLNEAEAALRRAIQLRPDLATAHANLGRILVMRNQPAAAVAACREAVRLQPSMAFANNILGRALRNLGQLDEAKKALGAALQASPYNASIINNAGAVLRDQGELDQAIECFQRAMHFKFDEAGYHSNLVETLHYHPGYDAPAILKELRNWNQRHAEPLKTLIQPHKNDRDPDRPLRIGYVSAYFNDHCQSLFTIPLLSWHDAGEMEVFCYSSAPYQDAVTEKIKALGHEWRDISNVGDDPVAQLIRDDEIDVLVDLNMHLSGNRLLVFARKPAPVQATWLAYPGSTGLSTMDYRITDPYLDPPGVGDELYSEKSFRLPQTFWCYDPLQEGPPVGALPARKSGQITFACLNRYSKVNAGVLELWARVLTAVKGSRMLILSGRGRHRDDALALLARHGVAADRIQFIDRLPRSQYLELYNSVDLCLDTVPYNAHTTALDSAWMGVPTVSLIGPTVVGRAGLSQFTNLNIPHLANRSTEGFVEIALRLSSDLDELENLRSTLRQRLLDSPLMDAEHFTRSLEAAYRSMWQSWCGRSHSDSVT